MMSMTRCIYSSGTLRSAPAAAPWRGLVAVRRPGDWRPSTSRPGQGPNDGPFVPAAALLCSSMATPGHPGGIGYGIRSTTSRAIVHRQTRFRDPAAQVERPRKLDLCYGNQRGSSTRRSTDQTDGHGSTRHTPERLDGFNSLTLRKSWVPGEFPAGRAQPHAGPRGTAPTYGQHHPRLWQPLRQTLQHESLRPVPLRSSYAQASTGEASRRSSAPENISKVLYPDDSTELARELRLKQQHCRVRYTCALCATSCGASGCATADWDDFAAR
ncbi:glycogen/starch/alpha-glucan phosphorylase [Actinoplanes nipponensis]|uniref:glycogen/starch/alpha-glucan phosphorylase n=1 Tax=Actinoplanes nipponensis TaxID=135950 RepID=UPI0034DAF747